MPLVTRDKNATWRSLAALCRERDWSKSRAVYELQNGLPYRTFPPGHVIDWRNANLTHSLNVETGEVMLVRGVLEVEGAVAPDTLTVSIEVLPPTDAAPAAAPTPPPPKTVSNTDLRDCILAIKKERPDDPLDDEALWAEAERRLGVPVARDRVREARKTAAPQWVNPVGRPRK